MSRLIGDRGSLGEEWAWFETGQDDGGSHVRSAVAGLKSRRSIFAVAALAAMAFATLLALGSLSGTEETVASSVHLKGGKHATPSFMDNGLTLTGSGALAGLGNEDVLITITAMADPTATCGNPGTNQHQAPGQNPAPVQVTGSVSIPEEEIKNGNTPFSVTTMPPVTPIPGAPDCPNSKWTEVITDMAFTSATIQVEQPEGTIVLTVSCEFDPATSDGAVPKGNVTCS
jgi:hypothetical protein